MPYLYGPDPFLHLARKNNLRRSDSRSVRKCTLAPCRSSMRSCPTDKRRYVYDPWPGDEIFPEEVWSDDGDDLFSGRNRMAPFDPPYKRQSARLNKRTEFVTPFHELSDSTSADLREARRPIQYKRTSTRPKRRKSPESSVFSSSDISSDSYHANVNHRKNKAHVRRREQKLIDEVLTRVLTLTKEQQATAELTKKLEASQARVEALESKIAALSVSQDCLKHVCFAVNHECAEDRSCRSACSSSHRCDRSSLGLMEDIAVLPRSDIMEDFKRLTQERHLLNQQELIRQALIQDASRPPLSPMSNPPIQPYNDWTERMNLFTQIATPSCPPAPNSPSMSLGAASGSHVAEYCPQDRTAVEPMSQPQIVTKFAADSTVAEYAPEDTAVTVSTGPSPNYIEDAKICRAHAQEQEQPDMGPRDQAIVLKAKLSEIEQGIRAIHQQFKTNPKDIVHRESELRDVSRLTARRRAVLTALREIEGNQ